MAKQMKSLSWNDRLAVINHFKPSDAKICAALEITADELQTARDLEDAGTFVATSEGIDFGRYAEIFGGESIISPKSTKSATTTAASSLPPASATKKIAAPKKRGRKGNNIAQAFTAIPGTPVSAEAFATEHGVSLNVLRQSKRFDKSGLGSVKVKKDKETKTLMIWRDTAE